MYAAACLKLADGLQSSDMADVARIQSNSALSHAYRFGIWRGVYHKVLLAIDDCSRAASCHVCNNLALGQQQTQSGRIR